MGVRGGICGGVLFLFLPPFIHSSSLCSPSPCLPLSPSFSLFNFHSSTVLFLLLLLLPFSLSFQHPSHSPCFFFHLSIVFHSFSLHTFHTPFVPPIFLPSNLTHFLSPSLPLFIHSPSLLFFNPPLPPISFHLSSLLHSLSLHNTLSFFILSRPPNSPPFTVPRLTPAVHTLWALRGR